MFICTIFRWQHANSVFKTQSPFRSQMHLIKYWVQKVKLSCKAKAMGTQSEDGMLCFQPHFDTGHNQDSSTCRSQFTPKEIP
jgi:hypothetical protein